LLTMTAITFTSANADFDHRRFTFEMGHQRPVRDGRSYSVHTLRANLKLTFLHFAFGA
jgi:hypothetical protein